MKKLFIVILSIIVLGVGFYKTYQRGHETGYWKGYRAARLEPLERAEKISMAVYRINFDDKDNLPILKEAQKISRSNELFRLSIVHGIKIIPF